MDIELIEEKEINGWKYYRSTLTGCMVVYSRAYGQQMIFENDKQFNQWLQEEKYDELHNK